MKYLCLIYEEEATLNSLSQSEWHDLRTQVLDYVDSLDKSGHLISSEPLQSARTATTLRLRNGNLSVTDGPFVETKEQLGGFFMIEARDLNEAIQLATKWPSARLGTIEVRPIQEGLPTDTRYR